MIEILEVHSQQSEIRRVRTGILILRTMVRDSSKDSAPFVVSFFG